MSELNADGDVVGARHQGEVMRRFVDRIRFDHAEDWYEAFTFYQFRDRGRLGLEIEDPNNNAVGIPQPIMKDYKKLLNDPYCMPVMDRKEDIAKDQPLSFRWGGSEDADGVAMRILFEHNPEFCELTFEDELSLMIEIGGIWFYKAPDVNYVDLMPAFYDNPVADGTELELKIFSTPPDGVNTDNGRDDWDINYYSTMTKAPMLRLRYEPVSVVY